MESIDYVGLGIQLFFLLSACLLCYISGRQHGCVNTIMLLQDHDIIKPGDIEKLVKKLYPDD